MKTHFFKKAVSVILCAVMLTALALPISAAEAETKIGYDASLIGTVDLTDAVPMSNLRTGEEGSYSYTCPTEGTNYTVSSLDELLIFSEVIKANSYTYNESTKKYTANYVGGFDNCNVFLTQDIDCSGIENFAPIGGWNDISSMWTNGKFFAGIFDGLGHTIDGITMDVTKSGISAALQKEGFVGLFRAIKNESAGDAGVKNLIIGENCKFIGDTITGPIGAVAGCVEANYTVRISNVYNKGDVATGGRSAGGLVGYWKNTNPGYITNCTNDGDIIGSGVYAGATGLDGEVGYGGMVGCFGQWNKDRKLSVTIDRCVNNGKIVSSYYKSGDSISEVGAVGGMVGCMLNGKHSAEPYTYENRNSPSDKYNLTIKNCVSSGMLANEAIGGYVGGIVGMNQVKFDTSKATTQFLKLSNNTVDCKYYAVAGSANADYLCANGTLTTAAENTDNGEDISCDTRLTLGALNYSLNTYSVEGYEGEHYSLRVVSMHKQNIASYKEYGYKITVSYTDGETAVTKTLKEPVSSNKVYYSVIVDGNTVTPDDGYAYIGAVEIENIPVALGDITVTVTPYVVYDGAGTVTGASSSFTVSPSALYS